MAGQPETPLVPSQPPEASFQASSGTPAQPPVPPTNTPVKDVVMTDAPPDQAADHSPAPARVATSAQGSRAASVHPDAGLAMPAEAAPHGDPTRRYLNTKVTAVLLEGMKQLAKDRPQDPLRVLGEFLIQKSREADKAG
ncbi:hypothetical protein L249_6379 [Ophiocordyceps polyrhachis-furcata BCC 54312]|uniref:Uncharacterized protein n=1 Tax=Ophiocordyceps polyrhachis-furcata BCC 54312 TaxID=1330021 RepID=A0A367LJL6_9HYPO|nr:hypothetical protein L249_6379 [Ophiocordyceps polyrhachis-furcata BCC 54312]